MFFHVAFKIPCLVVYIVLTLPIVYRRILNTPNLFVINFIVTVLLLAADFWTVKNVTGRLLVGLRWWNVIEENGESRWVFESRQDRTSIHRGESVLFWTALGLFTAFWLAVTIKNLFGGWDWLVIDLLGLSLCLSNLGGYLRCLYNARSITSAVSQYAASVVASEAANRWRGGGDNDNNSSSSGSGNTTNSGPVTANDFN